MDGERVNSPSDINGDETGRGKISTLTYTKIFNEQLPYYLSIGMSADEFWRGDVFLAKAYRKADEIRTERMSAQCWLQGLYIYEALCDVSPIFNPFAKVGTRPHPYPSEPHPLRPQNETQKREEEKKTMEKIRNSMDVYATKINSQMRKKEVSTSGR